MIAALNKRAPETLAKLWRPIRSRIVTKGDLLKRMDAQNVRMTEVIAKLDQVVHEVTPNSGGSMRDEVRGLRATLRAHGEASAQGLFETNGRGECLWSNSTYLRWTHTSLQQTLGYGWVNCIAESDRERIREAWDAAVEEKREFRGRYAMVDSVGNEFGVDCIARPVRTGAADEITGWVGTIRRRMPTGQQPALREYVDEE